MVKAGNVTYDQASDFPDVLPVFPLTGALLLPGGHLPLNIFEPRYLEMISDAMQNHRLIGIIQPCLKSEKPEHGPVPLSSIGCLGRITACEETGDGRLLISLSGICRYKIVEEVQTNKSYRSVRFEVFDRDLSENSDAANVDREAVLEAFRNYLNANGMEADWDTINTTDNDTLITALCMISPFDPAEKQALLEASDLKVRAETLVAISEFYLARDRDDQSPSLQ